MTRHDVSVGVDLDRPHLRGSLQQIVTRRLDLLNAWHVLACDCIASRRRERDIDHLVPPFSFRLRAHDSHQLGYAFEWPTLSEPLEIFQ